MICGQTRVLGVSVSQVARRYDVNANQVFNWLKDPRFADGRALEPEPVFLPVAISEARGMTVRSNSPAPGTLEVDLAGGHRLRDRPVKSLWRTGWPASYAGDAA